MTLALPMLVLYSDVIGIAGGTLVIAFDRRSRSASRSFSRT